MANREGAKNAKIVEANTQVRPFAFCVFASGFILIPSVYSVPSAVRTQFLTVDMGQGDETRLVLIGKFLYLI